MCPKKIEDEFSKLVGVLSINVNFSKEELILEYIPTFISIKKIQKLIKKLGYEALNPEEDKKDETEIYKEKELKYIKK